MELPGTIARGYFSPYHFARDYLYSAAAVLLTAVAAAFYLPEFRSFSSKITSQEPAPLLVAALLLFVSSHGLGFVANSMVVLPLDWAMRRRDKGGRSLFELHYEKSKSLIDRLYMRHFGDAVGSDCPASRREKMNRLIEFCRQHEAVGFVHIVRNYALIYFHRQVLVYFLLLGAIICRFEFTWHVLWLFAISAFEALNQARMVKETAAAELSFISATCARLQHKSRLAEHTENPGGGR